MEAHGGRIRAESDGPNLVARFTFTLTTVGETGEGPAAQDRREAGSGAGRVPLDVRPMRAIVSRLRPKLSGDADRPAYVFTEPRAGYWMPKGETLAIGVVAEPG